MKTLIAMLALILSSSLMAKTYNAAYFMNSRSVVNQLNKTYFEMVTPTSSGYIRVNSVENNQGTQLREKILTTDSQHLYIMAVKSNNASIADINNNLNIIAPAQIQKKPLIGTLIGLNTRFNFGAVKTIDDQVKEEIANALGTNNFKLTLNPAENNWISCANNGAIICSSLITRYYTIEVAE